MAKQLQVRRGTTMANDLFTGAEGEITMDTLAKGLRIHDGSKRGGYKVPTLVDVQYPSATNNYTWYRKYSDGWVEQGGIIPKNTGTTGTITLPVEMADTNYTVTSNTGNNGANNFFNVDTMNMTTTTMTWYKSSTALDGSWRVEGLVA